MLAFLVLLSDRALVLVLSSLTLLALEAVLERVLPEERMFHPTSQISPTFLLACLASPLSFLPRAFSLKASG